jgi:hypothetical protein
MAFAGAEGRDVHDGERIGGSSQSRSHGGQPLFRLQIADPALSGA